MSWSYSCPWCGAMLNPDKTIILTASRGGERVLIGFHPEPGNYELFLPPNVSISEGDHWDFFCPVCRENLLTGELEGLCELRMVDDDKEQQVFFSRIAGEQATLVVSKGKGKPKVQEKHGDHATRYTERVMPVRF